MDNKISNIKIRILEYAENKGFKRSKFPSEIGMSYSNFKSDALKTPINSDAIGNILSFFPDIDLHWLITGEKKYTKNEVENVVAEPKADMQDYKSKYFECTENYMKLNEELKALKASNSKLKKSDKQVFDKS